MRNPARPLYDRLKDFILERQGAYQKTFLNPPGRRVLADLEAICYASRSAFDKDPYEAARRAGARDVFLHISQQLNLSSDELYKLKGLVNND